MGRVEFFLKMVIMIMLWCMAFVLLLGEVTCQGDICAWVKTFLAVKVAGVVTAAAAVWLTRRWAKGFYRVIEK